MLLAKYKYNEYTKSYGSPGELSVKYNICFETIGITEQFHTHPDGKLGATQSDPDKSKDVKRLQTDKLYAPNARFKILYRVDGLMKTYDYTHEYKPKK